MLALDYRPHKFSDLVGQEHVVRVLAAILKKHFRGAQLPAALLFEGSKGTGKTTSARIVAALLNCANFVPQPGASLEPCGTCESCRSVHRSNCLFVHEIDAASSGLVDDIRKIKELATLSHGGNVRVIILDEAHSLSKQAFEALLKQLEEPMPHVLYIMCTTEPTDFPDTILSRTMRFTFKQLVPDLIVARLQYIAIREQIPVRDMSVLHAIAVKAQGAMRDAVMMLEQMSNYRTPLLLDDFLAYYGLVSADIANIMLNLARKSDIVGAKKLIEDNFMRSVDVAYFLDGFMVSVTEALHNRTLTSQQTVDAYKAAVEVKSKLKYMSAFVAANYLFALLLRVFAHEGTSMVTAVPVERLQEMFS